MYKKPKLINKNSKAKRNFKKAGGFPIIVKLFENPNPEIKSLVLSAIGYLITRERWLNSFSF